MFKWFRIRRAVKSLGIKDLGPVRHRLVLRNNAYVDEDLCDTCGELHRWGFSPKEKRSFRYCWNCRCVIIIPDPEPQTKPLPKAKTIHQPSITLVLGKDAQSALVQLKQDCGAEAHQVFSYALEFFKLMIDTTRDNPDKKIYISEPVPESEDCEVLSEVDQFGWTYVPDDDRFEFIPRYMPDFIKSE